MTLALVPLLLALALLIHIALHDYRTMTITNRAVLALAALYAAFAVAVGFAEWKTDLAAGGLLFALTFAMWLVGSIGAGDVKLLGPLGALMGFDGLPLFCVLLFAVSLVAVVALRLAPHLAPGGRLARMRSSGKLPYAVLLVAAAFPPLIARASSLG